MSNLVKVTVNGTTNLVSAKIYQAQNGSSAWADITGKPAAVTALSGTNTGDQDLSGYAPLVSPSFTTPSLGVATADSVNGIAILAGTGTLQLGDGYIDLRYGGSLNMAEGGAINTSNFGGAIHTNALGGAINTSTYGGAINTSNYGGAINTTAGGSFTTGTGNLTGPNTSGTLALTSSKLSAFAATTSSELAGVVSDETGTGALVFGTSPTLTAPTVTGYTESVVAIGTVTTSHTLALTAGTFQTATLTASTACTFTMPAVGGGKSFILHLKQAAVTGNGTATFTGVKWSGGTAPTITATAARMDILSFTSDGTNWYGSFIQNFTP